MRLVTISSTLLPLLLLFLGQFPVVPSESFHNHPTLKNSRAKSTTTTSTPIHSGKFLDDEEDDYDEDEYDKEEEELLDDDWTGKGKKNRVVHKEWEEGVCPQELVGHCHCGFQRDPNNHERTRPLVNCTQAGFTNATFLKHIPKETEVLIVRGNHIRDLPPNIFGVPMDALRELDLSDNGIEELKGKTFHHVPKVDTLLLNHNNIGHHVLYDHPRLFSNFYSLKYLHLTGAFNPDQWSLLNGLQGVFEQSNLTKLLKLHLEQNKISRVPNPRQFCDLKSLMDLHLGQNELTDLRMEVDDCFPTLRMVDLSYNQVREVTPTSGIYQLLNHLNQRDEPVQVELYSNPFHCDCHLEPFLSWMRNISMKDPDKIRHRSSLRCKTGFPESNKDRILLDVHHTECEPTLQTTNQVINRLSWTMLSLILLSAFVILMALYVHKAGLPSVLRGICTYHMQSPLLSTTTGVKYTSVDKEEVAEVAHV